MKKYSVTPNSDVYHKVCGHPFFSSVSITKCGMITDEKMNKDKFYESRPKGKRMCKKCMRVK